MQGTFEESFSSVECQRGFPASPGPTEHKRWLGRFVFSTSELDPSADRRERKRPIGTYNVQSMAMLRLSVECFDIHATGPPANQKSAFPVSSHVASDAKAEAEASRRRAVQQSLRREQRTHRQGAGRTPASTTIDDDDKPQTVRRD
uniref:Uncharacterized protein n=1 Tax=Coccidioides posadasii RMSCC 3488 TaxID=454284 RepID=A0A0J6F2X9_COCPO|nr:hypothetical protein CPAG_00835 [Coccidioides posadasii RMSCC 3488]